MFDRLIARGWRPKTIYRALSWTFSAAVYALSYWAGLGWAESFLYCMAAVAASAVGWVVFTVAWTWTGADVRWARRAETRRLRRWGLDPDDPTWPST